MAQFQPGGFVFTPPPEEAPEPSLFDKFMEKFTAPTMAPETVTKLSSQGPQETSNFLEDLSKNVLGETVTSFLPLTAPKRAGFVAGAAEALSKPSTMANIAAFTPFAAIATPANAAIALHGAGTAADPTKSTTERVLGGIDALTSGAATGLGIAHGMGAMTPKANVPQAKTPAFVGPADLTLDAAAAIEKKYPIQTPKGPGGRPTHTVPTVNTKVRKALETEFGLPEDPNTRIYRGKEPTAAQQTSEMARLKAELEANTPTDIPAVSPNVTKQAKGLADAEKAFTKYTDEVSAADQLAADKNAAYDAGATWSEPEVTVKTTTKQGGTTQSSTRRLTVPEPEDGVDVTDLLEGGTEPTGPAATPPKGAPPAGTSPLPKGVKRFYGSQQAAMLAAKNHNMQVVGHPDGTFEIVPFEGKAAAQSVAEVAPAVEAAPVVEAPAAVETPSVAAPVDDPSFKTKAQAVGAARKQGLPASLQSDDFIEAVEGGFKVNPNKKSAGSSTGAAPIVAQAPKSEPVPAKAAAQAAEDVAANDVNPESRPGKFAPPQVSEGAQIAFDRRREDLMAKFGFTGGRRHLDARPSFETPSETAGATAVETPKTETPVAPKSEPVPVAPKAPEAPAAAPIVQQAEKSLDELVQAEVDAGNRYGELKKLKAQGKATEEEVRAAGKAAQQARVAASKALSAAKGVEVPPQAPTTPKAEAPKVEVQGNPPAITKEFIDDIANLESLDPETRARAIQAMIEAERSGEKGGLEAMLALRMAGGLSGAAYGAATGDDLQERALRGVGFGALGAAAPDLLRNLPDAQRAMLLAKWPNLAINALAGPYGSSIMGSLEHALSDTNAIKSLADKLPLEGGNNLLSAQGVGNVDAPWAMESLKQTSNPFKFLKGWWDAKDEAGRLAMESLERGEISPAMAEAPMPVRMAMQAPGQSMTMGDISARNLMTNAGAPEEVARAVTMTDEPSMAATEGIVNLKRGRYSGLLDTMLPFVRTIANQAEGTVERTPLLGVIAQYRWKGDVGPDPQNLIVAQQILGAGVPFATAYLGMQIPPGVVQTPVMGKLLSNLGGQYGGLAVAGFLLGQGLQMGKPYLEAARDAGLSVIQSLPLPTAEPAVDVLNFFTRGEAPGPFNNPLIQLVKDELQGEEETPPSSFTFEPPQ